MELDDVGTHGRKSLFGRRGLRIDQQEDDLDAFGNAPPQPGRVVERDVARARREMDEADMGCPIFDRRVERLGRREAADFDIGKQG